MNKIVDKIKLNSNGISFQKEKKKIFENHFFGGHLYKIS